MEQPPKAVDQKIALIAGEMWLGELESVSGGDPIDFTVLRAVLRQHPEFVEVINLYRHRKISHVEAGRRLEPLFPRFLTDYAAMKRAAK